MFPIDDDSTSTLPSVDNSLDDLKLKPVPQLFLALACETPLMTSLAFQLEDVNTMVIGRGKDRTLVPGPESQLLLPDRWMSGQHAKLVKEGRSYVLEDCDSKNGTYVNGALCVRQVLVDGDVIECGHTFFIYRDRLPPLLRKPPSDIAGLATVSPVLAKRLHGLVGVAPSQVSVLIRGETGTGKELVARAVHRLSGVSGPFVAVNCGALSPTLLEGELFGYRKGAFSGAVRDHVGLVRSAQGGTLFLDEIGDLPLPAQAALLRVLQEREVLPLGEVRPVKVEFRLVSATHHDLPQLVEKGVFRKDLYARISGHVLVLPPLRERREDMGTLVATLLRRVAPNGGDEISFAPPAARALFRHHWPLNIRELERCLESASVLARGTQIKLEHLPDTVTGQGTLPGKRGDAGTTIPKTATPPPIEPVKPLDPEDAAIRDQLVELLKQHDGNISAVAREMGKARVQIRRWMKRFGLATND